ncbi:MAG: lipid II:glycine glycyltransferase FemX [Limisphaerales bacterium]
MQWTNPLEHSDWDSLILERPDFSFFHSSAWANVLTETYGYTPTYFIARKSGALHSLLPIMEVASRLTGRRGISLPFTDDCEPLCPDTTSFKKLFQNAIEFGKGRDWKFIEFRGGRKFANRIPASLSFHGHTVDLADGEGLLFNNLKNSVRRAIRNAEKNGVEVEISQDLESVRNFYSLQCKARRKHGLPPQPFSFFANIQKYVLSRNFGFVALARWQKNPIAASIFFQFGDCAIYKFGASDEGFQNLRGNNLTMWEAIKCLSRRGVKKMDLGRTSVKNEGLRRFKSGWGAEEKTIEFFKYDLRQNTFVADRDESCGWHNRVFRSLPSFASRLIGKALYRHWA